ncbi:MAG: DciA family protein [Oligosphaeraceae bacterium]
MTDSDSSRELLPAPRGRRFFSNEQSNEQSMDQLVADWVGAESAPDILGRFHPQPRELSRCLEKFLHRIGQDQGVLLEKIRENWSQLVGEQTSRQLRPVEIRDKTLVISAENQTYLYVLRQSPLMGVIRHRVEQLTGGSVQQCRLISPGRR